MQTFHRVARALGWFSVGLGLTELLAGKNLDRYLGTGGHEGTLRLFGLREIAAGAIILAQNEPSATSVWLRVGGDVMDLIFLGKALEEQHNGAKQERLSVATVTVAAVTALDIFCASKLGHASKPDEQAQEDANPRRNERHHQRLSRGVVPTLARSADLAAGHGAFRHGHRRGK